MPIVSHLQVCRQTSCFCSGVTIIRRYYRIIDLKRRENPYVTIIITIIDCAELFCIALLSQTLSKGMADETCLAQTVNFTVIPVYLYCTFIFIYLIITCIIISYIHTMICRLV